MLATDLRERPYVSTDQVKSLSELNESEGKTHLLLCTTSGVVKWRIQWLLLTLQLGSQTICRLLDADHDDTSKDFFDDGQKTEILVRRARRRLRPKDGELAGM